MSRRRYVQIALLTLPLPLLGAYAIASGLGELLPPIDVKPPLSSLLAVLGYLVVLCVCVAVWGAVLWPLRTRAGFTPLAEELEKIEEAGGLANAVAQEKVAMKARATSSDPNERRAYHYGFALACTLFTLAGAGVCAALWRDGVALPIAVATLAVSPILAIYHGIQWLRIRDEE